MNTRDLELLKRLQSGKGTETMFLALMERLLNDGSFTQPRWDDLRFPASGINPPGPTGTPTRDITTTFAGSLLFAPNATNIIVGIAQMPHAWLEQSEIRPHIHWMPTNDNTGNVLWKFEYQVANVNGTYPAELIPNEILRAGQGVPNKHQINGFAPMDMTGMTLSACIFWKLSRIGGDETDTYDADARLIELDFHYQIDTTGSRDEYIK